MEFDEFEEAVRKDDFALGDSFWLGDWGFEVVNRKSGGKAAEDEVVFGPEQGKEPVADCPGTPGWEQEENTGIQNRRQMIVAVAGQRIVDIYESENGRCWYITQRIQRQGQGFVSGYVRCLRAAVLAEFLHLPEEVLQDTGQRVWRVPQEAWWRCPCVDVAEEGAGPTIVRCEGEGSRPSPSCSKACGVVVKDGC